MTMAVFDFSAIKARMERRPATMVGDAVFAQEGRYFNGGIFLPSPNDEGVLIWVALDDVPECSQNISRETI